MQFIKDNDLFKVARITGPKHNFLAIRLSDEDCPIEVKDLPIKMGEKCRINSDDVKEEISLGLAEVNKELGARYYVSEVQYIPSDSPPVSIYRMLIAELIKRIHHDGDFLIV